MCRIRLRTSGSLAALPPRSGPAPRLDAAARAQLVACLRQEPDATLDELCAWGASREPGHPLAGGAGAGLAAKKKSGHAAERDTRRVIALRAAFVEAVPRFKFVDETSTNPAHCRRYARAEGGRRAQQATPLHRGPNATLVAALSAQGLR